MTGGRELGIRMLRLNSRGVVPERDLVFRTTTAALSTSSSESSSPEVSVHIVPQCGHHIMLEEPEAYIRIVSNVVAEWADYHGA